MKLLLIIVAIALIGCSTSKTKSVKRTANSIIVCYTNNECEIRQIEHGDK